MANPKPMNEVPGAIVLQWGTPPAGREQTATGVLDNLFSHFSELASNGRSQEPRLYINTIGNASECIAMLVVEGDMEQLFNELFDQDTQRLMTLAGSVADNFTIRYMVGEPESSQTARAIYAQAAAALQ